MNLETIPTALEMMEKSGSGYTPLLVGPAGVGKTETVRAYAKATKRPIKVVQLGQMSDAGDLIGLQYIKGDESKFTTPEWFPTEKNTILFFDEINRATKDIQQAIFQIVSKDKMFNGRPLPEGCFVVAAMNPPDDENYDVIDLGDDAFRDRFCYIKITPTATEWIEYARSVGIDDRLVSFIKADPLHLGLPETNFRLENYVKPTPRANEAVARLLNLSEDYKEHIVQELAAGIIGPVPAGLLFKHIKTKYSSIDMKKLLKDYSKVQKQVKEAVTAADGRFDMLSKVLGEILKTTDKRQLTSAELSNVLPFLKDLPKDMVVAFLYSFVQKKNNIEQLIASKGADPFWQDELPNHFGPLTPEDTKKAEEASKPKDAA